MNGYWNRDIPRSAFFYVGILLEADFLVNAYEDELPRSAIEYFCKKTAKTATGLDLIRSLFLP